MKVLLQATEAPNTHNELKTDRGVPCLRLYAPGTGSSTPSVTSQGDIAVKKKIFNKLFK